MSPHRPGLLYAGPRVLVVEESDINRRLARHLLTRVGCEADAVETGQEAVDAFLYNRYDLILMDCRLPGFPQFMVARIIRLLEDRKGNTRRVPIIGMTAFAPPGFKERCLRAGMNDCFEKPLNDETLHHILGQWIPNAGPYCIAC